MSLMQGERQVRGGGIYPRAALVNHDCLPNLARFDCFDAPAAAAQAPGANTAIQLRALHVIPPGGWRGGALWGCEMDGKVSTVTGVMLSSLAASTYAAVGERRTALVVVSLWQCWKASHVRAATK